MRRKRMGAGDVPEDDLRRNHPGEQRLVDAAKAVEMQIWIEKLIRSPCTWPIGIFGRNIMRELGLWEDEEKNETAEKTNAVAEEDDCFRRS